MPESKLQKEGLLMFNPSRLLSALLLIILTATSAYAFSGPGHEFVGALAENILIRRAQSSDPAEAARAVAALKKARRLLGKLSFADAATIPDEIKDFDRRNGETVEARNARIAKRMAQWPHKLGGLITTYHDKNADVRSPHYHHHVHFTDIAIGGTGPLTYSPTAVGAKPYDIVQTLTFCDQRLRNRVRDDGRGITPEIALILMIHLVGDLHQPLHVGAEYIDQAGNPTNPTAQDLIAKRALGDVGGNNLLVEKKISPPSQYGEGNLHHAWDDDIPSRAFEAWRVKVAPQLHKTNDQIPLAVVLADPKYEPADWKPKLPLVATPSAVWETWATEILPLAREAHQHFKTPFPKTAKSGWQAVLINPAEDYDGSEVTAVQHELLLAGYRLAWILENDLR